MSQIVIPPLPFFDRNLLCAVEKLVPEAEREEWSRAWQAELWHVHHCGRHDRMQALAITTDLSIGLTRDAFWLRTESWRRTFTGTAILCLGSLAGLSLLCTLVALAFTGGWQPLCLYLREPFDRCLIAAPFVLFVAFATASRRHIEQTAANKRLFRMKRQLFLAVKISQVISLAFLMSVGFCFPLHRLFPNTADLFQIFCFVLFSLVGMRWALHDQEQRCKQCLHSLTKPARVGRPSHNLLEWNGTELSCKQGHGLLSVPEMETSWCQSSHWVDLGTSWDTTISI